MRSDVLPEPGSEFRFFELTDGKRTDQFHDLFLRGLDAESVQSEEEIHGLERNTLVSINEGMVVGEAKAVCRGEGREIGIRIIVEPVSRTLES